MEYKLYCIECTESGYLEKYKRNITEAERTQIKEAQKKINTLKLLYEVPYGLKRNYDELIHFLNDKHEYSKRRCWNVFIRINEGNRLFFNIVSSLNAIENYYIHLLGKKEFDKDLKKNYISPHYDASINYRFLYSLRNYVNHAGVAATLAKFRITTKENFNVLLADKQTFLNDPIFKKEVKLDLMNNFDEEINLGEIVQEEIPAYINILLDYVAKKAEETKKEIQLIKDYHWKFQRQLKKEKKANEYDCLYGVEDPDSESCLNIILPIDFIKCYEENEFYADLKNSITAP